MPEDNKTPKPQNPKTPSSLTEIERKRLFIWIEREGAQQFLSIEERFIEQETERKTEAERLGL